MSCIERADLRGFDPDSDFRRGTRPLWHDRSHYSSTWMKEEKETKNFLVNQLLTLQIFTNLTKITIIN